MFSNRGAMNPAAFAAEAVELFSDVRARMAQSPPRAGLYPTGTPVLGPHGRGRIVGYNTSGSMFYGADRYPYVMTFDDGYTDVYGVEGSVVVNPAQSGTN